MDEEQSQRYEQMLQGMGLRHPGREPRAIQLNPKEASTARPRLLLMSPTLEAKIRDLMVDHDAQPSMVSWFAATQRSADEEPKQ